MSNENDNKAIVGRRPELERNESNLGSRSPYPGCYELIACCHAQSALTNFTSRSPGPKRTF
jgi:hypothetical protein